MKTSFSEWLLTENKAYLGQRIGDVLSGLHDLSQDAGHLGTRQLIKMSTQIVNQIRRILHSAWPKQHEVHLKKLQKIAVAIMAAIEEKDDLENVLKSAATELETLAGNLGVPLNNMGSPEDAAMPPSEGSEDQGVAPPQTQQKPNMGPTPPMQQMSLGGMPAPQGMPPMGM